MPLHTSMRWLSLSLAVAIVALALASAPASAQAGRTPEAEADCTPDVMRLCSAFIPNVGPIVSCLKRRHTSLSRQCKRHFRPGKAATKKRGA